MTDWCARCELCNEFKFEPDECVVFRRTSRTITPAESKHVGMSGVGCVCENCVRILAKQLVKPPTPPELTEPADEGE